MSKLFDLTLAAMQRVDTAPPPEPIPSPSPEHESASELRKMRLSTLQDMRPVINQEKVQFVLDKLPIRGAAWAREFMDRVEGFDAWPKYVRQFVETAEQEAA